ncbi:ATP-binding protein [Rhizobium ruizarguesonis]|uniref:ATP-binding protein n=1 Tax=Rhizobium ruizarguesonis TaxID=2081791 RepID=UPI00102F4A83|nr:ATP-binding protein [Rhizobium ruizarguesonis]TBC13024.1 ATP-binding protein [Rhizobium ruizarguesonis]
MSNLVDWLAGEIRSRVAETASGGESRLIFHGPPLEILGQVYERLAAETEGLGLPVLLQIPEHEPGGTNPPIGSSGRCDETHLLDLRNSPTASSYLALVPPRQHAIRSVSSTTDEFGVAGACNGANVPFDDWWADSFVQRAIGASLEATKVSAEHSDSAAELVQRSMRAVDDVDQDRDSRRAVWRLLSRVFAVGDCSLAATRGISLACGVPPMSGDKLSSNEQHASLDGVAAALSDGFRSGLINAVDAAATDQKLLLEAFLQHIRSTCDVPTALERAPEAFYAPASGLGLIDPPAWWMGLTAELWAELLSDEPEITGDIRLECLNPLLPASKGVPLLVERNAQLAIRAGAQGEEPVAVTLERSPGKNVGGFPGVIEVEGEADFTDVSPPPHRSPIQYKASAENHKPASIKVISLETWLPGIFVACRPARKITAPKAPARRTRGANWETSISLPGPGRYELLVFMSPGTAVGSRATGTAGGDGNGGDDSQELVLREMRPGLHQLEVEADGSYQVDITFERTLPNGKFASETCRVFLSCDDVVEDGCRSEFERLIKLNRRHVDPTGSKPVVQLNRSARTSSLQAWMLQDEDVSLSYLPLVLAEDYGEHWVQPKWSEETGRILSVGRFLQDPRPPASHFVPPAAFVEARRAIAALVRGPGDQSGLLEAAPLGEWVRNHESFPGLIEQYLDAYAAWLKASPEVATWSDVVAVASLEPGGRTLSRVPDAILLSPLHPLRLAWHAVAQGVLDASASSSRPCPAAGVLDPGMVPDILRMPIISPEGIEHITFLAVESNSDYWSVLWNGSRLRTLAERSRSAPFGPALGLSVGGISTGFSASQVERALDDVSNVLCAKPIISVVVTSAGGATDSCNEGLVAWSGARYAEGGKPVRRHASGPRRLDVFDTRIEAARPDEATIANLSEDTRNHVRWFSGHPRGVGLDLGIIAQLDSSEPEASETTSLSALGAGGLIRHRIRRQLPGFFLSESRQSRPADTSGDPLADKVAACIGALENTGQQPAGLRFAPNVHAIGDMLEEKKTDFVAISSSAVDPACFLGGWLPQSYLWDYDLPSYSHRAGDTNGYYLLSRVKASDRDGLRKVLSRLPGCETLDDTRVEDILLEVARRGIPTIRGLAGDDTGATGDLGLFVAARLLQDRFRLGSSANSLMPVIGGSSDQPTISLVIPVDPFRGYLDDLSRALNKDRPDASLARPDLLVVGINLGSGKTRIHLTPIEVKCRLGSVFPAADVKDALGQARSLADLLCALAEDDNALSAWRLAYQHLLLSMIGFGMRVYSAHQDLVGASADWAGFHERIAGAILGVNGDVTIDRRGRLIIVDDTVISDAVDRDGDGFEETMIIGTRDAGRIVAGDAQGFYDSVRAKVEGWSMGARRAGQLDESAEVAIADPLDLAPEPAALADPEPAEQTDAVPLPSSTPEPDAKEVPPPQQEPNVDVGGVELAVGMTVDGFERRDVSLLLSDTRLNQLNMGVVGDLGTGKTQLLKSLVFQIASSAPSNRGIKPRILIFDYKRDYSSDDFVEATGARVVKPYRLPLNLFDTAGMEDSMVPWLDRFRFFADVLDKIYSGIGPVQRDKLKRAVRTAYENCPGRAPTIYDVHSAYADLLDGKSDSPMSIIDDLVDMEIFEPDPTKTKPFADFLDGAVVISLDALGQDDRSKNMLVAVMLNMFYENMLRTPKRPFIGTSPQLRAIDSYLLVDEADNIMRYEFDVLRKLLLQGREFGCGVILASQYLRHFKVNATDYREPLLTWFVHKVPNVTAAELSALGLASSAGEIAERIKGLPNHHCLYKSFDVPGQVIKGLPFYELMANKAEG